MHHKESSLLNLHAALKAARARGRIEGTPTKNATTIRMAMLAMTNLKAIALEVAKRLGIITTTLYAYVNSDGSLKETGTKILVFFEVLKNFLLGRGCFTDEYHWHPDFAFL